MSEPVSKTSTPDQACVNDAPRSERDWRSMSIVEIAAENPSAADYIKHWEGRTERAETALAAAQEKLREAETCKERLQVANASLSNAIDCACNALTDSIKCSGNDAKTNMHFVRKLRQALTEATPDAAESQLSALRQELAEARAMKVPPTVDELLAANMAAATAKTELSALREELERVRKLAAYGRAVLAQHREEIGDIDGAWLQATAVEVGLLHRVMVTESCGEFCRCSEYGFPQECLRLTDADRALPDAQGGE